MFRLGVRQTLPKMNRVPSFPKLKENNARTGYFEVEEYRLLRTALPSHLRPVLDMGYFTDMGRGEILNLRWRQTEFLYKKITLDAGSTKNGEARIMAVPAPLLRSSETSSSSGMKSIPPQGITSPVAHPGGDFALLLPVPARCYGWSVRISTATRKEAVMVNKSKPRPAKDLSPKKLDAKQVEKIKGGKRAPKFRPGKELKEIIQ
jgi:hypothetical protein